VKQATLFQKLQSKRTPNFLKDEEDEKLNKSLDDSKKNTS